MGGVYVGERGAATDVDGGPKDAVRIEWNAAEHALILHHDDASKNGTVLTISVGPFAGGGPKVVVNGAAIFPAVATATATAASPAASAAVTVVAPAAAATTPAAVVQAPAPPSELDEVVRRLAALERTLREAVAHRTRSAHSDQAAARVGLAFVLGVPIVAALAARLL
jgi:hypothetical protein